MQIQMKTKVPFPIGLKPSLLISIGLVLFLSVVTIMVSILISSDVRLTAENNNRTVNQWAAGETETILSGIRGKALFLIRSIDSLGWSGLAADPSGPAAEDLVDRFYRLNPDISCVAFTGSGRAPGGIFMNDRLGAEDTVFNPSRVSAWLAARSEDLQKAAQGGTALINGRPYFGSPLLVLLFPLREETEFSFSGAGAVFFSPASLEAVVQGPPESLSGRSGGNISFIINGKGDVLIPEGEKLTGSGAGLDSLPIIFIRQALENRTGNLQTLYTDGEGLEYFGAFQRLSEMDAIVITVIESRLVFQGVFDAVRRIIIIGFAVLVLSVFCMLRYFRTINRLIKAIVPASRLSLAVSALPVFSLGIIIFAVWFLIRADVRNTAMADNDGINYRAAAAAETMLNQVKADTSLFLGSGALESRANQPTVEFFFNQNSEIAAIVSLGVEGVEGAYTLINRNYTLSRGIDASLINACLRLRSGQILEGGNASSSGELLFNAAPDFFGLPLLAVSFPYTVRGLPSRALVFFSSEKLTGYVGLGASPSVMLSPRGDVLIHSDGDILRKGANLGENPAVKLLRSGGGDHLLTRYREEASPVRGGPGGTAFASIRRLDFGGVMVLTAIPENVVYEGINAAARWNIYFAISLWFISLLLIRFFNAHIKNKLPGVLFTLICFAGAAMGLLLFGKDINRVLTKRTEQPVGVLSRIGRVVQPRSVWWRQMFQAGEDSLLPSSSAQNGRLTIPEPPLSAEPEGVSELFPSPAVPGSEIIPGLPVLHAVPAAVRSVNTPPVETTAPSLLKAPGGLFPSQGTVIDPVYLKTNGRIIFSWDPVNGANAYIVTIRRGSTVNLHLVWEHRFVFTNLSSLDNGEWSWQVEAVSLDAGGGIRRHGEPGGSGFRLEVPMPDIPEVNNPGVIYEK
jgi:hypothetical protein